MSPVGGVRVVPGLAELPSLPTMLNEGELAVLNVLSRLGPGWHVFVQPRLAMAQPDFVAVHPEHGVWVIEVKDWAPDVYRSERSRRHRWIEVFNGERWVQRVSPIKQVLAYEETFRDRFFVDRDGLRTTTEGLRVLLVLPRFTDEQGAELLGYFPLATGTSLTELADRLQNESTPALPAENLEDLLRWLDEPENVSDQRLPLTLSKEALSVAENPNGARVRRVRGPAGSGKSLGLAARAIALAAEGKSVLVLSFNITLVHYLHDLCARAARHRQVGRWQYFVSFSHFHGLLRDLIAQVGERCPEDEAWESWAIEALGRAYSQGNADLPLYDAVLVDEGQDFEPEWWNLLRAHLLRPDGEMLLVADRTQNLFERANWTDAGMAGGGFSGPWAELQGTYRIPVDLVPIVSEYARTYLSDVDLDLPSVQPDHPALAEAHEPTRRTWINVAPDDAVERAADEVWALIRSDEGLSPSDIVLLTDHEIGLQVVAALRASGCDAFSIFSRPGTEARRRLKRAFYAGTPGVKGCTVHSFKGWESRAVVCIPSVRGQLGLYIAMTRVKAAPSRPAFLTVVNAVEDLHSFKSRFERKVMVSEVPALAGQRALDL